ncbi:MAG: hypothetical protein AAF547_18420 [Actinomycetota bacterium]
MDRIVDQSDAQSGANSPDELERIRARNLAGFLKVLEARRWGAGVTLADHRAAMNRATDRA